ncbi:MAG: hypothetical protein GC178_08350 [Flavobacteriales bacterium]|nr:hypothetical protein [Flavobacteriales bacterium]
MKTVKVVVMSLTIGAFIGCGGGHHDGEHHHEMNSDTTNQVQHAEAKYQCPMDCEDGKTYEQPGKCPVCEMELTKVEE